MATLDGNIQECNQEPMSDDEQPNEDEDDIIEALPVSL